MRIGINNIPSFSMNQPETPELSRCFRQLLNKIGINRKSEYSAIFRYRNILDLIFYNRLLRCFVVIEIKTHKLTHEDLGQLQMYVNYYDRFEKLPDESPTVGILLCTAKNDLLAKITLPEDNTKIMTSKYQLYLPSEKDLLEEIKGVINLAGDAPLAGDRE